MTRSWLLVVPMRPTLTNAVHNMHHRKASADRKLWRGMGHRLTEAAQVPPLASIEVTCWGVYPGGRLDFPEGTLNLETGLVAVRPKAAT